MKLAPIHRNKLIKKLKELGYSGPYHGWKHDYLVLDGKKVMIPNVHSGKKLGIPLLQIMIRQLGITKDEFIAL